MVIVEPSEEMYLYNRMRFSDFMFQAMFGTDGRYIPYNYEPHISRWVEFDDFDSFYSYKYPKEMLAEFEGRYFLRFVKEKDSQDGDFVLFGGRSDGNVHLPTEKAIVNGEEIILKCSDSQRLLVPKF